MTFKEILEYGVEKLEEAGIEEAKVDAMLLLEYVCDISRTKYLMYAGNQADEDMCTGYKAAIEKRSERIPLQYITGSQDFMGFQFKVDENVLIPRYDTEVVVEEAIKAIKGVENPQILDVCTGSGCIAISLSKLVKGAKVRALDISEGALKVAKENNIDLEASVDFIQSDLFENISSDEKYDLIISNPPYIKTEVIKGLMAEVKNFEPMLALDGAEDGLKFYKKISEEAPGYLKAGGILVYEIGCDQAEEVSELLRQNGFTEIIVKKDLAGLNRAVVARMP